MKIKEILSGQPVVSVQEDDSIGLATQIMLWAGVHHLPVLSASHKLTGLLEDRDILVCRAADGAMADHRLVKSVMSAAPPIALPDEDVAIAAQRMLGRGVSCLAVIERGRLTAVLTTTDLLRYEASTQAATPTSGLSVASVMQQDPVTAAADDLLMDALARMASRNIRHLPVISANHKVIGILSDHDVRTAIGDPERAVQIERAQIRLQSLRVADAMSRNVLTVSASSSLSDAAARFVDYRIGALPVVDESERLIGIVSYLDLLMNASFPDRLITTQSQPSPASKPVFAAHHR